MRTLAAVISLFALITPAHATDVVVRVSGVIGTKGTVRVAVCVPEEYKTQKCRYAASATARAGTTDVTIPHVPSGHYAVIAHHDRTGDGVVHTNWLGIPTDGVGASRNVEGRFGPPSFDQVAIDISGPTQVVDITLKREPTD